MLFTRLFIIFLFSGIVINAQDSIHRLKITGFAELYYQYDFNKPVDSKRPDFLYNHTRHNEVNLNLGLIKLSYPGEKVRGSLAMATGTYMNANYAEEPGVLKNIFEANLGVRIYKNIWVDAGIMPSHIGVESAIVKDNPTLTRSIGAENSPYYETGVKISCFSKNNKLFVSGLILNGWQRISRIPGSSSLNLGSQIQYKPNDAFVVNYSNFYGSNKPDSLHNKRFFQNFFIQFSPGKNFQLFAGFDVGVDNNKISNHNAWWSSVFGIMKLNFKNNWSAAGRFDYFNDEENAVLGIQNTISGYNLTGYSLNIDKEFYNNLLFRTELRSIHSDKLIFEKRGSYVKSTFAFTTSLSLSF